MPPDPTDAVGRPRLRTAVSVCVVLAWLGAAAAAVLLLPGLSPSGARNSLSGAVSTTSPAIRAEIESVRRFDFPLLAQNVVVQHDPAGLSLTAQAKTVERAVQLDTGGLPGVHGIAGALPVTNELKVMPSSRQSGTTALTYLFYRPSVGPTKTARLSDAYATRYLGDKGDGLVGVTGAYQAEADQGNAISGSLRTVELVSIGLLILIVAATFRSLVAPALTLLAAGLAYEISQRLLGVATAHLSVSVPAELDPILIVLLLGIVTDYSVFYLSATRRRLRQGEGAAPAAKGAGREVTPVVLAAGLTVASGTALIATAHLALFADLGPGLAITVAVAVAVASTFVPAALWLLRTKAFWPAHPAGTTGRSARTRLLFGLRRRLAAGAVVVGGVGLLVVGGWPVHDIGMGINLIGDLPGSGQTVRAADAAAQGFAPGIVAPTEILVNGAKVGDARTGLFRLQAELTGQPGVAGVLGPADTIPGLPPEGVFVAKDGSAARFLVILDAPPLGSAGIASLRHLEAAMPALLRHAGVPGHAVYAGDTAISASITGPARGDLLRVGLLVMLATFLVMVLFLRSLATPLVLLVSGALTVAAALGVTTLLFSNPAGDAGFTFYVPFAAEVLLLAFGADYNLFLAGEIWHSATNRPFRDAVPVGAGRAASAINIAGVTLASSFIVLLLVPLASFRELAVAMAGGLLIDTFLVRLIVVPAALQLLGSRSRWPWHLPPFQPPDQPPAPPTAVAGTAISPAHDKEGLPTP